jgi:hypothetical protein
MPHHVLEPWLHEKGWPIWNGRPEPELVGRVGWLIRTCY